MKFMPAMTFSTEQSFTLDFTVDEVLALLHDTKTFIHINPARIEALQDVKNGELWHITEEIRVFGRDSTTTFQAQFHNTDTGFQARSQASLGVRTTSDWEVTGDSFGAQLSGASGKPRSTIRIKSTLSVPFVLYSLVKGQFIEVNKNTEHQVRQAMEARG